MIEIEIPLSTYQRNIANHPAPIKVVIGGRRSGKSLLAKAMLTKAGLEAPGRSLVVMPIQTNANDFFTEMYTDSEVKNFDELDNEVDEFGETAEYNFGQLLECKPKMWPFPLMTFKGTRHRLGFRSFENPTRIRGGNCTGIIVCDEAKDLNGDEVKRVLISKILDTKATLLLTGTITHHDWLWDLYLQGQEPGNRIVKSWMQTTPESPAFQGPLGKQRLADLRSLYPQWQWDAEMLCIPGTDNTTLFPYLDQCLTDKVPPEKPEAGRRYIMGLDLGRIHDHEEIVIIDDEGQVVFTESFELGLTHELMAQRVAARARFWNCIIVIDATGGGGSGGARGEDDSFVKVYRSALEGTNIILRELFWSSNSENASKRDIMSHLSLQTEQRKITICRKFEKLISQMRRYKLLVKGGKFLGMGCSDGFDDCVAATAEAFWGLKNNWLPETNGTQIAYV